MNHYKKFEYKGDIGALAQPQFMEAVLAKAAEIDHFNQASYQDLIKAKAELVQAAAIIWGKDSKQYRYLSNAEVPKPPSVKAVTKRLKRQFEQWQERENQRQKRQAYYARQRETVAALESNGYVEGENFSRGRAITFAKEVLVEVGPGVFGNRMLPAPEIGD